MRYWTGENRIALMINLNKLENYSVRLHSSLSTDIGRSIKVATDNMNSIGVVKGVYGIPTSALNRKSTHI